MTEEKKGSILRWYIGGLVGTGIMTTMMYKVAPMILGKPMDIAAKIAPMVGGDRDLGLIIHWTLGVVVAPTVGGILITKLFRPTAIAILNGVIFGQLLWLGAMVFVMPMIGNGAFMSLAGGIKGAMASLMAHSLYGAALGKIGNLK